MSKSYLILKIYKNTAKQKNFSGDIIPMIIRTYLTAGLHGSQVSDRNVCTAVDDTQLKQGLFRFSDRSSSYADDGCRLVAIEFDGSREELISQSCLGCHQSIDYLRKKIKQIRSTRDSSLWSDEILPITIDKDLVLEVSASQQKQPLIDALDGYISRIQLHQNEEAPRPRPLDFEHGFWFFTQSRAVNRQANYYLAQALKSALERPNVSISQVFFDLENKRSDIFEENNLDKNMDRGINSSELNQIIQQAKNSAHEPAITVPNDSLTLLLKA